MTEPLNEKESAEICQGVKGAAGTVAGAGIGTLTGVAGVATVVALCEVILPVTLCLVASGLAGGAIGLLCSIGKKKKCRCDEKK